MRSALLCFLFTACLAFGHHAFASEYDASKLITVSGTVTSFEWTNPHAWIHIEGADQSGNSGTWSFEMGSPGGLQRRGWRRNELKDGDRINISGFASKDGRNVANATNVTLPDGRKLFGGFGSTPRTPTK